MWPGWQPPLQRPCGMNSKQLIVNADDFGWSTGVNRGIIEAHRTGILTSTTLLANFPAFADAVRLAGETPTLGVGLHLNLVHGPPLCPPARIPSLVDHTGRFPGAATFLRRLLLGRVRPTDMDQELRAQYERFHAHLGAPTHLDSHKHMHAFGGFRLAALRLAGALPHPRLRCPEEPIPGVGTVPFAIRAKAWLLARAARRLRAQAHESGVSTNEQFRGLALARAFTVPTFVALLAALVPGSTEIMCHPGYASDDQHAVIPNVSITNTREQELRVLCDPALRAAVTANAITLVHYGQL